MSPSTDLTAQYKLEQVLSWTGLGRTFRGQHPETGAPVAVKVLSLARTPGSDMLGQRFLMTARVLSSLNHHTLPEVVNYGMSSTGDAFLVTSWFEGEMLSRLVPIEPRDLLALVIQLTQGLESLALHGLVHLNLSPDNILVSGGRPRLTGWGHSLLTVDWQSDPGPPDSQPNAFTAPELCDSRKVGDALWRADLYSLGAITASLLGAEMSRTSKGTSVKFQRSLSQQLQQPELLRGVLERCLLLDAEGRLDSYSELARAIQHAMPRGRGADRSVSDTQPLARIRPQDVEQVARRLEEAEKSGLASVAVTSGIDSPSDEPGTRRDLFDLRELNPDLTDERTPSIDADMADEIAQRIDRTGTEVEPPADAPQDDDVPSFDDAPTTAPPPVSEQETVITRSVKLPAASSVDRGIDRTLITSSSLEAVDEQSLDAASTGRSDDESTNEFSTEPPPPRDESKPSRHARSSSDEAREDQSRASTGEIAQSEDPTVVVPGDAVKAIRSGVLPAAGVPSASAASRDESRPTSTPSEAESEREAEPKLPPLPIPPAQATKATPSTGAEGVATDLPAGGSEEQLAQQSQRTEHASRSETKRSASARARSTPVVADVSGVGGAKSAGAPGEERVIDQVHQGDRSAPSAAEPVKPVLDDGPKMPRALLVAGLIGAALFFLVLVVLAIGALRGEKDEEPLVVAAPEVELPPVDIAEAPAPPPVELPPELIDALELFVQDDLLAARGALGELEDLQEEGTLPDEICVAYRALADSVLMARVNEIQTGVRREMDRGRVDRLRRILGTVSSTEADVLSNRRGTGSLLADARSAVAAVNEFEQALRSDDPDQMLEQAEALRISYPSFEREQNARERAADQVQQTALEMADNGQLEEALRRLQRLQSLRPDRREVIDQMGRIERRLRSQERFDTLAAAIERTSSARRPSEGLSMLQGVAIPTSQAERFAALRDRLQRELAQLDAQAPQIRRADDAELEFRRGDALLVPLEITDDYELVAAELSVRDAEGTVTVLPLEIGDSSVTLEITPSVHGGRDVLFWVTAVDRSGNIGRLGSSENPLEAKRRRWFRR